MAIRMTELQSRVRNGVLPAMATPLLPDGYTVNGEAIGPLVELLIRAGVKGLFVGGTTGEGILLERKQRQRLHKEVVTAVRGRVPVLVHVGANTTREARALAAHANEIDADAVVLIPPTFFPMPDDALLAYCEEIAALVPDRPFLVYDIPHLAINGISPVLLQRLRRDVPNLAGIKTSRPDAQVIRQVIDVAADQALVLAGNERIALGSLALGASGLISGLATAVPEPFVALTQAFADGKVQQARQEQKRINRLLDLMPPNARIGAIKVILQQRGINAGPAVPPRPTPTHLPLWEQIEALL